jgi:hypothetical protein
VVQPDGIAATPRWASRTVLVRCGTAKNCGPLPVNAGFSIALQRGSGCTVTFKEKKAYNPSVMVISRYHYCSKTLLQRCKALTATCLLKARFHF